jgi:hypothetical protein
VGPSLEPLRAAIAEYFQGEKTAGAAVLPIGVLFAAIGIWLFLRPDRHRVAAWPLWLGALAMFVVGAALLLRSDAQARAMIERLDAPSLAAEIDRLARVVTTFTLLKLLWCALIVAAVAAPYWIDRSWVRPVGIGIVADAALFLLFDLVADGRARVYLDALRRVTA